MFSESFREAEEEFNMVPDPEEYEDQKEKNEYSYEEEYWDWRNIEEMQDKIKTKSGRIIPNFRKKQKIENFNK